MMRIHGKADMGIVGQGLTEDASIILIRPDGQPRALRGVDRIDLDEVLPGFELTAQELFDSLRLD